MVSLFRISGFLPLDWRYPFLRNSGTPAQEYSPMTGLDVEAVQVLKKLIQSRATFGKSVLFSSHILEICENLCDKIVIMQAGMIKKTIELRDNPSETSLEDIYMEVVNDVPMGKDFSIKQSNR